MLARIALCICDSVFLLSLCVCPGKQLPCLLPCPELSSDSEEDQELTALLHQKVVKVCEKISHFKRLEHIVCGHSKFRLICSKIVSVSKME